MADCGIYDGTEKIYDLYGAKVVVDTTFNIEQKQFMIESAQVDPTDTNGVCPSKIENVELGSFILSKL